ncbi:hypothetical protein MBANPS3_001319 [Mucor bainieri]
MSNSNINDRDPAPATPSTDNDVISIAGSLLDEVHIDFGHEEEDEDSVFDHNLMQYLDQLPIAAPPADAKYSASFVDSVLSDIETFKQEAKHPSNNDTTNKPFMSPLLDYSSFKSEAAYSREQDTFSVAVEQPRGYDDHQEQLHQEQEEMPIQFNMHQDDQSSIIQPALSLDYSTEYSDYLDIFNLGQDQPNINEFEATFLAQRKAELDALFDLNEDASKDFSSWFYYSDEDAASQLHFKCNAPQDDMSHLTTNAVPRETVDHLFSTQHPIESVKEANHPFFATAAAEYPFESSHLSHSLNVQQPSVPLNFTANDAYDANAGHQVLNDILQRMGAVVTEKRTQAKPAEPVIDTKNKPSSSSATPTTSHVKSSAKGKDRRNSLISISKADFMLINPTTSSSKHSDNLSNMSEDKNETHSNFDERIEGTSTPVVRKSARQSLRKKQSNWNKKQTLSSKQQSSNGKRRSTILGEVDKNASSTSNTSHRYSMRARTSPTAIRKQPYNTPIKPVKSRTFDLSSADSSKKR